MKSLLHLAPVLLALVLCLPSLARASAGDDPPPDTNVQHYNSITISPIHLTMPVVELTGERRFDDKLGAGVILGAGRVTTTRKTVDAQGRTTESDGPSFNVLEAGATFRFYALGNFVHGMQLGAEATYMKVLEESQNDVAISGSGLSVGPFIGYKIAANVGFTFDAQLGYQYLASAATASSGSASKSATDSAWAPMLNLNLGWSF